MQKNESSADRIVRAIAGVALLAAAYLSLSGIWQIAGYVVGAVLVFTAATGFCLLYKLLGIDTNKQDNLPQ